MKLTVSQSVADAAARSVSGLFEPAKRWSNLTFFQSAADAASALAVYFGEASYSASSSSSVLSACQDIFAALASFARLVSTCDVGLPV